LYIGFFKTHTEFQSCKLRLRDFRGNKDVRGQLL